MPVPPTGVADLNEVGATKASRATRRGRRPANKKGSSSVEPLPLLAFLKNRNQEPCEAYLPLIVKFAVTDPPSFTSTSASSLPAIGCQAITLCFPTGTFLISKVPSSFTLV